MNRRQSLVKVHFCWPAITKGEALANRPIGMGRGEQTGHSRRTRGDSSVGNLGDLGRAKAKRGVGGIHSSGEAGQCPWSEGIPRVKGNVWNRKREIRLSEKTYTEEEAAHIAARRGLPRFVKLALRQEGLSKTSQEVSAMTVSHGKPYAGKPHVRFDEGAGVPGKGRPALLHE